MTEKKQFEIKCRHMVDITYRVTAENSDEALEALCDKDLFTEYSGGTLFGPSDYVMQAHGIEVIDTDCYGDPSATGRQSVHRAWEIEECGEVSDD